MSHPRFAVIAGLTLVAGAAGAAPSEASRLAYVDPGSGSFILQALVAMLAGAIVALKFYWTKIKSLLGMSVEAPDDDPPRGTDD